MNKRSYQLLTPILLLAPLLLAGCEEKGETPEVTQPPPPEQAAPTPSAPSERTQPPGPETQTPPPPPSGQEGRTYP